MNPIFEYFLKRVKDKAGIKSPSAAAITIGSWLLIVFRGNIMSKSYERATRFKRPYTLPRLSWGLKYAPLSAAVCRYDSERFEHTDEPVSVLEGW